MAAHGLYQEVGNKPLLSTLSDYHLIQWESSPQVKQWDHTDNEIIAAAKKIAYLMAHLRSNCKV